MKVFKQFENTELAEKKAKEVFKFINDRGELDTSFFVRNEISHLEDVKHLLTKIKQIFFILVGFFLILSFYKIYIKKFKGLLGSFLFGGIFTLALVVLTTVLILFRFDWLFIKFHEAFFAGKIWSFSLSSNLIKLFPEDFFYDITLKILLNVAIISLVGIVISTRFLNRGQTLKP